MKLDSLQLDLRWRAEPLALLATESTAHLHLSRDGQKEAIRVKIEPN